MAPYTVWRANASTHCSRQIKPQAFLTWYITLRALKRRSTARFGGFCGGMFIVGSGLSTLETAANPFIATCGPPRYSELRLTLAQAFQAIGSVVAPVLASQVIFKNVNERG